jgi:hypothetical protein
LMIEPAGGWIGKIDRDGSHRDATDSRAFARLRRAPRDASTERSGRYERQRTCPPSSCRRPKRTLNQERRLHRKTCAALRKVTSLW